MDIYSLPPEVLTRIFAYLPLKDRKNVRLVCWLWYDCCTRFSIIKQEQFVFRSGCCIQEITKLLTSDQRVHLNLEFQGMPVDTFPTSIWKKCGDRMISLSFHECKLSDKTVKNIVTHCSNLKIFKFQTSLCSVDNHLGNVFCSSKALDELINQNVVRRNLITFEMFVDDAHLPSHIFRKIFRIYPSIKSFGTGCYSFDDADFIWSVRLHAGHIRTSLFSRIDKYLTAGVIEKLRFNFPTDGRWMKALTSFPALRLRKLETIIVHSDLLFESTLTFFTSQKHLEVIKLSLVEANDRNVKQLLFHVLKVCVNLRELWLNITPDRLSLNQAELSKLFQLSARLQCLSLNFRVTEGGTNGRPVAQNLLAPSVNENLRTLQLLESDGLDEDTSIAILNHCRNLRHFELSKLTDRILQELFKTQTSLETLILNEIDLCSDFGFTGQASKCELCDDHAADPTYSIARLRELVHLEIEGYCSEDLTEAVFYHFTFPCLKYLRFAVDLYATRISKEPLMHIAESAPRLEAVTLEGIHVPVKSMFEFCKLSKSLLRLTYCNVSGHLTQHHIHQLFENCPTLRFISNSEDDTMYCYNPFTKRILIKRTYDFKFKNGMYARDLYQMIYFL